jgi:LL-diaminopimelate aminotransferase
MGSKNILALLPLSFINPPKVVGRAPNGSCILQPGDVTLMTTPGYPVLGTHTGYLGGSVVKLPLREENGFLPDLNQAKKTIEDLAAEGKKVKLFCLNYPNNPTGADAPLEFWNEVSALAHEHNFVVAHDAAYAGLAYGRKPTGILQAEGGLECGIGIYSMSKAFNMIGRRIAFAAAHPKLVAAHANIKDNSDSGQDSAIQRAAAEALANPEFTEQISGKYERRLGRLVDILNSHGFSAKMPAGSFFLYTKAPTGTRDGKTFANAEQATKFMLEEHGVSTVPWDDVGAYLRFSATFDAGKYNGRLKGDAKADGKILSELDKRLGKMQLKFD